MSSMLGCVAAVIAIVSPSHPRPAVTHRTSISAIASVLPFLPAEFPMRMPLARPDHDAAYCIPFARPSVPQIADHYGGAHRQCKRQGWIAVICLPTALPFALNDIYSHRRQRFL